MYRSSPVAVIFPVKYRYYFGKEEFVVDKNVLNMFSENVILLHPLPRVNEISTDVDDDPRACYFEQAHNGLWVRMALLLQVLNRE